jgi:methylphosphotriester-DNA--protein-cysteine methyltransferase
MIRHPDISSSLLFRKIKMREVILGGNYKLKIYGNLNCVSGKKMSPENRVFFSSEREALENGYRPCGHCMKLKYEKWKKYITV